MRTIHPAPPWSSKSRVNRAGNNIRNGLNLQDDIKVLDEWRAAHRNVLNTFQASLRQRTSGTPTIVAQRHKRKNTIIDKLKRFPDMQLSRMDDIAGCRLIFNDIDELYEFRKKFHSARFKHKRKNDIDKYDYIKNPKQTGYRGVHDVYSYNVRSRFAEKFKGLQVEIQYRTRIQHAWATAVEVIGFITESQPKFQRGDNRYEHAMSLTSEIFARVHENKNGPFPELSDIELVRQFAAIDDELNLVRNLNGLNISQTGESLYRNAILIFGKDGDLEIKTYRDAPEALRNLFELEERLPGRDIVLVKADSTDDVRLAFKNYFSDAREFIDLLNEGCEKLSGREIIPGILS